jgi:hypothetical protein
VFLPVMCVRSFKEVLDERENEVRRKVSQEKGSRKRCQPLPGLPYIHHKKAM